MSLSDFLTLFAARTVGPFWTQRPGPKLAAAACLAMGISSALALTWPFGGAGGECPPDARRCEPDAQMAALSPLTVASVWAYVLVWWLVQARPKPLASAPLRCRRPRPSPGTASQRISAPYP